MTRVACYGVIVCNGEILLVRVAESNLGTKGMWTLPGGGVDFGEHPEAAVRREVQEETGLEFEPEKVIAIESEVFEFPDSRMHAIQLFFSGQIVGGALRNEQGGSTDLCQWVTLSEASKLPLTSMARAGMRAAAHVKAFSIAAE